MTGGYDTHLVISRDFWGLVVRLGAVEERLRLWCHSGTIPSMDVSVNVKGLEAEIVQRLAEQAEREGVSAQEWMRQALRRTAALLTPRELDERVATRTPISADRYQQVMESVSAKRAAALRAAAGVPDRRR